MKLENLVGHLALRTQPVLDDDTYMYLPVLVLACKRNAATVCYLEDTEEYTAGAPVRVRHRFMDDNWTDYGEIAVNIAQTKTQIIAKCLRVIGIEADEQGLEALCKCITFKQLLGELSGSLGLNEMLEMMTVKTEAVQKPIIPVQTEASADTDDTAPQDDTTNTGRVVRRGV